MNKDSREDIQYLLTLEDLSDYNAADALEAYYTLLTAAEDMAFQISLGESEYTGADYRSWLKRVSYKMNKTKAVARRFSVLYQRLKEESELNFLKSTVRSYLNGSTGLETTLRGLVE
jgi:hypothetical protein